MRGNNHFVRLEDKWVLIDGPWYDELEQFRQLYGRHIRIPPYDPIPAMLPLEELIVPQMSWLDWEAVRWHNGGLSKQRLSRFLVEKTLDKVASMNSLWNFAKSLEWLTYLLTQRYYEYLSNHRVFIGWCVCPDGKIPRDIGHE